MLDQTLIEDGAYFVHEVGDEIVACGGWSRRGKLYSDDADDARLLDPRTEPARVQAMFVRWDWTRRGRAGRSSTPASARLGTRASARSPLMATLPGEPLYRVIRLRRDRTGDDHDAGRRADRRRRDGASDRPGLAASIR